MNTTYLRIVTGLQALIVPLYLFILRIVEDTERLPPDELKIPHNLFYLHAFDINLERLWGLCMGLSMSTLILAVTTHKEWQRSKRQSQVMLALIMFAPVLIMIVGWQRLVA
jgi:hypothetical protein